MSIYFAMGLHPKFKNKKGFKRLVETCPPFAFEEYSNSVSEQSAIKELKQREDLWAKYPKLLARYLTIFNSKISSEYEQIILQDFEASMFYANAFQKKNWAELEEKIKNLKDKEDLSSAIYRYCGVNGGRCLNIENFILNHSDEICKDYIHVIFTWHREQMNNGKFDAKGDKVLEAIEARRQNYFDSLFSLFGNNH